MTASEPSAQRPSVANQPAQTGSAPTPVAAAGSSGTGRRGPTPARPAVPPVPPGPPTTADEPSLGTLVSEASTHFSTLMRSEIELAKLELKSSVKNAGVGAGMFAAAAVVLVFSLTFGFLALAEGIAALGLSRWLAFLIVFVAQLLVVGALAFLGIKKVKRVKAPEKTIKTSKETVAYLKNHG